MKARLADSNGYDIAADSHRQLAAKIEECERFKASRAALLSPDVAGLVPVAFVVQADRDGSFDNRIAPAAWSTFDLEMGKLRQHAWVKAGTAKVVPLYSADALESLAAQNATKLEALRYVFGLMNDALPGMDECAPIEHIARKFVEHHKLLAAQVAERDVEIARLKDSLGVMYDRYEDGVDCHEGSDGDSLGSYIGKAVQLTEEEENKILALIPPHRRDYPKEPT